jgi:hypothetical protein
MKVAAAEWPEKTDTDQVDRDAIVRHSRQHKTKNAAHLRSHCACLIGLCRPICLRSAPQTLRSKEHESNDQNGPSMPPPMYMLISKLFL